MPKDEYQPEDFNPDNLREIAMEDITDEMLDQERVLYWDDEEQDYRGVISRGHLNELNESEVIFLLNEWDWD